jgi:hypothetical protein
VHHDFVRHIKFVADLLPEHETTLCLDALEYDGAATVATQIHKHQR